MELELRHVFEFDHDNEINAHALKEDLSNMDKYLESHEQVQYRTYECHYEKGGIKITKEEEGWNRCAGYVAGMFILLIAVAALRHGPYTCRSRSRCQTSQNMF